MKQSETQTNNPNAPTAVRSGDLLGCPFCGGEAHISKTTYDEGTVRYQGWGQATYYSVRCIVCGADNRGIVGHKSESAAKQKWNTRANLECKHLNLRFVQSASGNESWYECAACGKPA